MFLTTIQWDGCIKHPLKISNYWKLLCSISRLTKSCIVFVTLLGSWSLVPEIHFCSDTVVLQHGSLHRLAQQRRKWNTMQSAGRSRRVAFAKGIADFAGTEQRSDHLGDRVPQLLLTGWGETRGFGRNPKNTLVVKGSSHLAGMPSWILLMALALASLMTSSWNGILDGAHQSPTCTKANC